MKSFAEKVLDARSALGLTQPQLAELVGVSTRAVVSYEKGEKCPRQSTMMKLAKALRVSVKFLSDDNCEDPLADIEKDGYIEAAHQRYGAAGVRDMDTLLQENTALFAGGELSQEQKDMFFQAVMKAYITCKEEASQKFGHKK